jgi:hypothetical protein
MTPRGQALHKPRGRKPRHAPMRFGEAKLLWGFDGSQWARWRQTAAALANDMTPMRDGDSVRPDLGMKRRSTRHVLAA